jgi:predicted nucleic acid-binding protein
VAEAVARRLRHHLLGDDLRRHREEQCAFTDEELTEARAKIFGASRVNLPRLNRALSRVKVEPVTEQAAKAAAELLKAAALHGHKCAIDATVAEAALRQPPPVAVLTSDTDDMAKLCGDRVRLIAL